MAAAPLSSPSADQANRYFAPPFPPTSSPLTHQQQHKQQYSDPISTSSSSTQTISEHPSIQPSHHRPQLPLYTQRGGPAVESSSATSPFLRDFNLVAEAAKRAQMAVLMRDMEGVAL